MITGKTFGEEINLSNSMDTVARAEIVALGDNVDVSWWEKSDGKDQPMIRTSNDGGKTFGEATCADSQLYFFIIVNNRK